MLPSQVKEPISVGSRKMPPRTQLNAIPGVSASIFKKTAVLGAPPVTSLISAINVGLTTTERTHANLITVNDHLGAAALEVTSN